MGEQGEQGQEGSKSSRKSPDSRKFSLRVQVQAGTLGSGTIKSDITDQIGGSMALGAGGEANFFFQKNLAAFLGLGYNWIYATYSTGETQYNPQTGNFEEGSDSELIFSSPEFRLGGTYLSRPLGFSGRKTHHFAFHGGLLMQNLQTASSLGVDESTSTFGWFIRPEYQILGQLFLGSVGLDISYASGKFKNARKDISAMDFTFQFGTGFWI